MNIRFSPPVRTIADLLHSLGDVDPVRVRATPSPGTATFEDLLAPDNEMCELVDGTLVEKVMGWEEGQLDTWLTTLLNQFVIPRNLGVVVGPDALVKLFPTIARAPDAAFTSWNRMPGRRRPTEAIPPLAPDLAVEVLSLSNRPGEMIRKRNDYFGAGVLLVWEIDPRARTVRVYTAVDQFHDLTAADTLDGGAVLPGFSLPLADLFAELDRHG